MPITERKLKERSRITLEMSGKEYKSDGTDAFDALMNLGVDFTHIKTKGTVTLRFKGKKSERFLYLIPLRRIFSNKTRKAGLAKQLVSLLK